MAKGSIENTQLMNTDTDNYVALANDFIQGKCSLSKNSKKLFRMGVMQIKPQEEIDVMAYCIDINDFGQIIGSSGNSLYRHLDRITDELITEPIYITDKNNPKNKWIKLNYCSRCSYDNGKIYIVINNELKPYLVGLKKYYSQYRYSEIAHFKSEYGIDLYELIKMALFNNHLIKPKQTVDVTIMMDVLRRRTDTETKYKEMKDFKRRVVDPAVKDINNIPTGIQITGYENVKKGREIVGLTFHVTSWSAQHPLPLELQRKVDANIARIKEKDRKQKEKIKEALGEEADDYFKLRGED